MLELIIGLSVITGWFFWLNWRAWNKVADKVATTTKKVEVVKGELEIAALAEKLKDYEALKKEK